MSGIGSRKDGKTNGTKQRARKQKIPPQGRDFLIGKKLRGSELNRLPQGYAYHYGLRRFIKDGFVVVS